MLRRLMLTLALAVAGVTLFRERRRLLARLLRLPPPTHSVRVTRDLPVAMPDGVTLLADHYAPVGPEALPTILIRSPYGRASEHAIIGAMIDLGGSLLAERGYHVVNQGTRGRFRSGGRFNPLVHEAADGRATLEWVAAQPWFNGSLGMWGPSYLGYNQWAVAVDAPPYLRAIVPMVTSARFSRLFYPVDGVFCLESSLRWAYAVTTSRGPRVSLAEALAVSPEKIEAAVRPGLEHTPITESDRVATGETVDFFQDWLANPRQDTPFWRSVDVFQRLGKVEAPAHLVAGWYDIFLRDQLADYAALLAAGRTPYLTVGPHHHNSSSLPLDGIREGLAWFDAHLKGRAEGLRRRPVRVYLMGADEWHEMDFWPPLSRIARHFLGAGGVLQGEPAAGEAPPSRYDYRPADPTPNLGGALLISPLPGRQEQGPVEARPDVLTFTTPPLEQDVDVIGPVRLELYVRSSLAHTDFVGRLCEVEADGRSYNVCDGIFRLAPGGGEAQPDGTTRIEIDMWATAQRFRAGSRIRLQVASAGHPRWSRNLGTGELFGTPHPETVAHQQIFHDAAHPSALVLPVVTAAERSGAVLTAGAAAEA